MPILPDIEFPSDEIYESKQPSRTYKIDFITGKIYSEKIDGKEAIKQFILKAILTPRYKYLIYSEDYGCEIRSLIGKGFTPEFIASEIQRMVTEAIIYDDRIEDVYDFEVVINDDYIYISFKVDTNENDTLEIKEAIRI